MGTIIISAVQHPLITLADVQACGSCSMKPQIEAQLSEKA